MKLIRFLYKKFFVATKSEKRTELKAFYDDTAKVADYLIWNYQNDPSKIKIGKNSLVEGILIVNPYGGKITIGDYVFIGRGTVIQSGVEIKIGNDVQISNNVYIVDNNAHEIDFIERQETARKILKEGYHSLKDSGNIIRKEIIIQDNAWINFNCIILKGVTIGKGSIIGAGSVVTKDVPPNTLVAGNPAQIMKYL